MKKNKSTKRLTTAEFIEKAKHLHGYLYDYSKVLYISSREKVTIICKKHGEFEQKASLHLEKHGCKLCANLYIGKSNTKDNKYFIKKAKEAHKNRYDYGKVIYTQNKNKVLIVCKVHGDFKQIASLHLLGSGCPNCGIENKAGRSAFVRRAKDKICTFYTLKCFNKTEEFYKIGVTMRSIKERYKNKIVMPYAYEVISEIHGKAVFIWDLELQEKRRLKEFNYKPVIKFCGSATECFTQYKI